MACGTDKEKGSCEGMAFGRLMVGVLLGQLTFLGVLGAKLAAAQSLLLSDL